MNETIKETVLLYILQSVTFRLPLRGCYRQDKSSLIEMQRAHSVRDRMGPLQVCGLYGLTETMSQSVLCDLSLRSLGSHDVSGGGIFLQEVFSVC